MTDCIFLLKPRYDMMVGAYQTPWKNQGMYFEQIWSSDHQQIK